MQVIAIASRKGGAGKTTLTAHLAVDSNATLGEWLRHYWVTSARDLSPRSRTTYRSHIERIDPEWRGHWSLGAIRLRDITHAHAGKFKAWASNGCGCAPAERKRCRHKGGYRGPLKVSTVRSTMWLIRAGLDQAVARGMLPANPWKHAKLPRGQRRPPAAPGRDDFTKLRDCPNARVRLLLLLAAYTGARRSELLGLTWENIDLRGGNLTVGASLDHQRGKPPELKELKTKWGRRTIKLPTIALSELRLARVVANALAVNLGRRIETVPVFAVEDGGWWTPEAASKAAHRALEELGLLPGSLDTLRHAIPPDDSHVAEAINRIFARQPGATGAR